LRRKGTLLSALESMACGCSTITTNVAGLNDLPAEKAAPNPVAIKNIMIQTLKNLDKIANSQQKVVLNKFNTNLWKQAWIKVINTVLK
jgi:glycosyltransferase involved in cell wall biosynthesis